MARAKARVSQHRLTKKGAPGSLNIGGSARRVQPGGPKAPTIGGAKRTLAAKNRKA